MHRLPPEWKDWADHVEASRNVLVQQIGVMWVAIAILGVVIVALGIWLYRIRKSREKFRRDFEAVSGDIESAISEREAFATRNEELEAEARRLSSDVSRLNGTIARLRQDEEMLVPPLPDEHAEEAAPPIIIDRPGERLDQIQRLERLCRLYELHNRCYRIIALYIQQTGGLAESPTSGLIIKGHTLYVCPAQALTRLITREQIIADGERGEHGIGCFRLSYAKDRLVDIRPFVRSKPSSG